MKERLFGVNGEIHHVLESYSATKGRGDIRASIERVIRIELEKERPSTVEAGEPVDIEHLLDKIDDGSLWIHLDDGVHMSLVMWRRIAALLAPSEAEAIEDVKACVECGARTTLRLPGPLTPLHDWDCTDGDWRCPEHAHLASSEAGESDAYDPNFGDGRLCACGHPYCRHFDSYEGMVPTACKYCPCPGWRGPGEGGEHETRVRADTSMNPGGWTYHAKCSCGWRGKFRDVRSSANEDAEHHRSTLLAGEREGEKHPAQALEQYGNDTLVSISHMALHLLAKRGIAAAEDPELAALRRRLGYAERHAEEALKLEADGDVRAVMGHVQAIRALVEQPGMRELIQAQSCKDCGSPCRCEFDRGLQLSGACCVHGEAECAPTGERRGEPEP